MSRKQSKREYIDFITRIERETLASVTSMDPLGEPIIEAHLTSAISPGPVSITVVGATKGGEFLLSPWLAWQRYPMVLTLQLDGSGFWDYSTVPTTEEEMATFPSWVKESIYNFPCGPDGNFTVRDALEFATEWNLEFVPFSEIEELITKQFPDWGENPNLLTGKDAESKINVL